MKNKFKKGDIVEVNSINNASQFNTNCDIMGVFRNNEWMYRRYEVGDVKETKLSAELAQFAYSLYFEGKLEGHVYENELKLVKAKKYKVSKEFIKEFYGAACETWKRRIKKEFPELFEVEMEKNRWYRCVEAGNLVFYCSDKQENYGISFSSHKWDNKLWVRNGYTWELATKEEVEQMLWKEAEKRGIGKDTKIEKCMYWGEGKEWANRHYVDYQFEDDRLFSNTGCVYNKGQFATPLNPNKEIQDKINSLQKQLDELKAKVN